MRVITLIAVLLVAAGRAEARQAESSPAPKKWDVSVTVAAAHMSPGESDTRYWDDWYFAGRYAAAIGRYWTEHLKTEVEYARSGEDSIYFQDSGRVAETGLTYPITLESFHRLEQLSARMTWQFGRNTWIHPYVSGGIVGDRERQRRHIAEQYGYPVGRERLLLTREFNSGPTREYRLGFSADAGAKFYVSRNAFIKSGVNFTFSGRARTFNLLAGFGMDF
jgi:opacity protein-like surface antigen